MRRFLLTQSTLSPVTPTNSRPAFNKLGLHVNVPASFVANSDLPAKLKARALWRELAAYRYGIFKESGFRHDPLYPPFASTPGFATPADRPDATEDNGNDNDSLRPPLDNLLFASRAGLFAVAGFDESLGECGFETAPSSGLPLAKSANCLPLFVEARNESARPVHALQSLNLMNADPFLWLPAAHKPALVAASAQLLDAVSFHFCGQNLANIGRQQQPTSGHSKAPQSAHFEHNSRAQNKQNLMCGERSALDVIRSHDDFKSPPQSR